MTRRLCLFERSSIAGYALVVTVVINGLATPLTGRIAPPNPSPKVVSVLARRMGTQPDSTNVYKISLRTPGARSSGLNRPRQFSAVRQVYSREGISDVCTPAANFTLPFATADPELAGDRTVSVPPES